MKKDIVWFRSLIAPSLEKYNITYSFFENGDFGNLDRVEVEGNGIGGNIDFWEKEWLEIHLIDYNSDTELIHALLDPEQESEKNILLEEFEAVLIKWYEKE